MYSFRNRLTQNPRFKSLSTRFIYKIRPIAPLKSQRGLWVFYYVLGLSPNITIILGDFFSGFIILYIFWNKIAFFQYIFQKLVFFWNKAIFFFSFFYLSCGRKFRPQVYRRKAITITIIIISRHKKRGSTLGTQSPNFSS